MKYYFILSSFFVIFCFSCKNGVDISDKIVKTLNHTKIVYSLKDSLFMDTMKFYSLKGQNPYAYQIWDRGTLLSEYRIDKKGKWHQLKFIRKDNPEKNRIAIDYIDENNSFYDQYDEEIYSFFDESKIISSNIISNRDTTSLFIYNVPYYSYIIMSNDSTFNWSIRNSAHRVFTKKSDGDKVALYMVYLPHSIKSKEIQLIVKYW